MPDQESKDYVPRKPGAIALIARRHRDCGAMRGRGWSGARPQLPVAPRQAIKSRLTWQQGPRVLVTQVRTAPRTTRPGDPRRHHRT